MKNCNGNVRHLGRAGMLALLALCAGAALAAPNDRGDGGFSRQGGWGVRNDNGAAGRGNAAGRGDAPRGNAGNQPGANRGNWQDRGESQMRGGGGYAGRPPAGGYAGRPPAGGYAGPPPAGGYAGQAPAGGYGSRMPPGRMIEPGRTIDPGRRDGRDHNAIAPAPPRPGNTSNWGPGPGARGGPPPAYPRRGTVVNVLPAAPAVYWRSGVNFYFSSGIWYRPYHTGFVVIAPPIGVVIPLLPAYYETRFIGGMTYYYADDVYYRPVTNGYEIVNPPQVTTSASGGEKVFYYPRNGQSQAQQDADRYQCYEWAVSQSGYDPTLPNGGIAGDPVPSMRDDYSRAMSACMDGRGYTMR